MRVITGTARGMTLKAPKGMDTRPTMDQVKEGIFSAIQFEVEGRRALDLFAGSGQLGIEALSRGAREAVFVDARRDACQVVRENLAKTRLAERAQVVQMDYLSYLGAGRGRFDLVFLDPPYAEVFLENALKRISEIDQVTGCAAEFQRFAQVFLQRLTGPVGFKAVQRDADPIQGRALQQLLLPAVQQGAVGGQRHL